MSTPLRQLRSRFPYLTPPFAGEDDDVLASLLRRPRADIPPILAPPELLTTSADITPAIAMRRAQPLVPFDATVPPPPIASLTMPTRISDERLAEIGAPPMVIRRDGRPTTQFIGEGTPEERLTTRRRALEEYQPQKESKKHLALRTILGFLGGGLAGRGGVAETLLGPGGIMDRRGIDRAWQQGELAKSDETLGRMRLDRRAGLQDRLLESQVAENEAQAARALREPAVPPLKPTSIFEGTQDVEDEEGNVILVGANGQPLINPATGKPFVRRRLKPPTEKPTKPDTSPGQRRALMANIQTAEGEKKKIADALANTAEFLPDTDQWGVKVGERPNPIHQQLKARERKLDDDLRDWNEALGKLPESQTQTLNATEQRIYDAAAKNPKLDPNEAVRRYREGKF